MIWINDVCCINLKKKKLVAIHKYLLGMSNYGIDKLDKINSKCTCTHASTHMHKYYLLKKTLSSC